MCAALLTDSSQFISVADSVLGKIVELGGAKNVSKWEMGDELIHSHKGDQFRMD